MNTIKKIIFALSVLVCASTVHAASWNDAPGLGNSGNSVFSMSGVQQAVITSVRSNSVYIITSDSAAGSPSFDSVWVKPDLSGGALAFWSATNSWVCASNQPAGTNIIWLTTTNNAMASNDVLVLKTAGDVYQMLVVSGNATDATGLVYTNALGQVGIKVFTTPTNTITALDKVYKMAVRLSVDPLALQNVTNDVAAPWGQWWQVATRAAALQYVGEIGEPAMVSLTYSNAGGLFVSGRYLRR